MSKKARPFDRRRARARRDRTEFPTYPAKALVALRSPRRSVVRRIAKRMAVLMKRIKIGHERMMRPFFVLPMRDAP